MAIFYPILYGLWPMTAIFFRNTQKCTIYALYIACTYYTKCTTRYIIPSLYKQITPIEAAAIAP